MAQRGRRSALDRQSRASVKVEKPKPPSNLNKEEAAHWKQIVDAMRNDHFTGETHALLAHYCRKIVLVERFSRLVHEYLGEDEVDLDEATHLMKCLRDEGTALTSYATKMRITQQATRDSERRTKTKPAPSWAA